MALQLEPEISILLKILSVQNILLISSNRYSFFISFKSSLQVFQKSLSFQFLKENILKIAQEAKLYYYLHIYICFLKGRNLGFKNEI